MGNAPGYPTDGGHAQPSPSPSPSPPPPPPPRARSASFADVRSLARADSTAPLAGEQEEAEQARDGVSQPAAPPPSELGRPQLSVTTEFAGINPQPSPPIHPPYSHPHRLQGHSAATFSSLHTSASTTLPTRHVAPEVPPPQQPQRSHSICLATLSRPRLSDDALSSLSQAIREHLERVPNTPQTPCLLTQDSREQKLILLKSLFQSIDRDSNGFLEREELLNWAEHEPWLKQEHLQRETERLLASVTHDEDSRVSMNEFLAAFHEFSTPAIIMLIVNLLRAGMVCKLPRLCYVYNSHDWYTNGLYRDASPDESPEPGSHSSLSVHDSTASTLVSGVQKEEVQSHFFLLEVLFQAMDRDLDGQLDVKDLHRWLRADPFVHDPNHAEMFEAVDNCWRELTAQNEAAGFVEADWGALDSDQQPPSLPVGPARIDRHFVFLQLSQVPKKQIRKLLVHLLSRNASNVMEKADQERHDAKVERDATVAAGLASAGASPATRAAASASASPTLLPVCSFPLVRKHSVVVGGSRRVSLADGLRVSLCGQSMIQHDIRKFSSGRACVESMTPLLAADVVFTELETSLVREGREGVRQRNTVFFHAAPPDVIDALTDMGFNFFSAANNHAGDLGEAGLLTLMEEFEQRKLCMGGVGMDASRAALPVFLDTKHGRIAQVSFASKVPEHSIARDDPPRPGVSVLRMADVETRTLDPFDLQRILDSIGLAREGFVHPDTGRLEAKADMIVAYHHNHYWEKNAAVNFESRMGSWKRELAHMLIDAGAHVYVAHGDPRLQGIEIYQGCPLFYCLGNFIFQTKTELAFYGAEVWQSVIVHMHCAHLQDQTTYSIKLIPLQLNEKGDTDETHLQTRGIPSLASRTEGLAILHKLSMLSAEFGTAIRVEDSVEGDLTSPVVGWVLGAGTGAGSTAKAALRSISKSEEMPDGGIRRAQGHTPTPSPSPPYDANHVDAVRAALSAAAAAPHTTHQTAGNLKPPPLHTTFAGSSSASAVAASPQVASLPI